MFPIDTEFLILYFFYLLIGLFLIYGTFFSIKHKNISKINLVVFLLYSILFGFIFSDKSNFEGGSSLFVLFYTGLTILIHFVIILLLGIYKSKINNCK